MALRTGKDERDQKKKVHSQKLTVRVTTSIVTFFGSGVSTNLHLPLESWVVSRSKHVLNSTFYTPETNKSPLKIGDWKTNLSFWEGPFSRDKLVFGKVNGE